MRRALACLLYVAVFAGLGCRQLADIEDILPPLDASGTDAFRIDASTTDGSREGSRADAIADGGHEAAACVKIPVDAAVPDALPDAACPVSGTCTPDPSVGFSPTWVPPRAPEKVCSATQISDLYDSCFGSAGTQTKCDSWYMKNAQCKACAISLSTDPRLGPLVIDAITNVQTFNQGGCVALLEPCNFDCAVALQASTQCAQHACDTHCPTVTNQATFNELSACLDDTMSCPCQAYWELANACACTIASRASPAQVCLNSSAQLAAGFKELVSVFCGE